MAITIGRLRIGSLASNLGGSWNITPDTPTVTINSNTSLTVDWVITGLDKTVTAVELWHSTDGTTYTKLVKLGAVATYDHDGLENNSIHYYKVRYWSGISVSGFSGVVSARTINYVDYIESSGTQYIDTGLVLTNQTSLILDGIFYSTNGSVVGGTWSKDSTNRCCLFTTSTSFRIYWGDIYKSINTQGNVRRKSAILKNKYYENDVLKHTFTDTTFTTTYSAILFMYRHSNDGTIYTTEPYSLYNAQGYDANDILIFNYKPALNLSGQFCMFDEVSKTYKLNVGTGIFTGGGLTTAEIDAALIQYAADGVASVTIDFRGDDNGTRSSASDAAVATLTTAGCTIYTN